MKAIADKYVTLLSTHFKFYIKYPLGLFLKLIYLPVQMIMSIFLWIAISTNSSIDVRYMIKYYLLVNLLNYAYPFAHISIDIESNILDGTISNNLVRPVGYYVPIVSKYLSWMIIYSVVFIPVLIGFYFFEGVSIVKITVFIAYVILGMSIEFLIWYNIGLLAFFLGKTRGVRMMIFAVRSIVSGTLLPLSLFPEIIQKIIYFIPFRYYIYVPVNTVLSDISYSTLLIDAFSGCCWILVLWLFTTLSWNIGIQKYQNNIS